MKVRIEDGGGFQGITLVIDAVPRVGLTDRMIILQASDTVR